MTIIDLGKDRRTDDGTVGIEEAEQFTDDHPGVVRFARIGWAAKGVVYGLVGLLSLLIAIRPFDATGGSGGGEASQSGAISTIAQQPFGTVMLWAMALGLLVFSLWRFFSIALPADNDSHTWATRAGYLISAVTYLALAWTSVSFARRPGSSGEGGESENSRVEELTRSVMEYTGGRWLIALVGVGLLGACAYFVRRAVTKDFASQIRPASVGPVSYRNLIRLGQVGWIGRAAMLGLIGFFLVRAAWMFDPEEAQGLDGALRDATDSTFGMAVALVVAVGLLVYGTFCVLSAPNRLLVAADD